MTVCDKKAQLKQLGNSSCLTPKQESELETAVKAIAGTLDATALALEIAAAAETDPTIRANLIIAVKVINAVNKDLVANLTKIANESCGTCTQIAQAVSDAVQAIKQTLEKIDPAWETNPIWKAVFTAVQAILAIVKEVCPSSASLQTHTRIGEQVSSNRM